MNYVIDKIVNGTAVCECLESDEKIEIAPPKNAKEGDVLKLVNNKFIVDAEATKHRQNALNARLQKLFT